MTESVDEASARLRSRIVGHSDGAQDLHRAWTAQQLTHVGLRDLLPLAWTYADPSPETVIGPSAWVAMFRDAGQLLLPTNHPALNDPMTLYRGALPARQRGMAWTIDRHTAEQFRRRRERAEHAPAFTFRTVVPLEGVLGAFAIRGEHEIVVDPAYLEHLDQLG